MLGIFVKGSWYSTFITAKYIYSTQKSYFVNQSSWGSADSHPGGCYPH